MKKLMFLACIAIAFSACEKSPDLGELDSDLAVYTNYDASARFDSYQTYFLPDSILEAGNGLKARYWKDENAKQIISQVAEEMAERGYTRITDPEEKDKADLGLQLSYVARTTQVVSAGGGYFGGWWDSLFWGPWWGDWYYYPYPIAYTYNTGTFIMEMVDLSHDESQPAPKKNLPVIWYSNASGLMYDNSHINMRLLHRSISQSFQQSSYIRTDKSIS